MDKKISKLYPNYFVYPALVIFSVFFIIPVLASFILSFTDWHIDRLFEPKINGLDNILFLIKDEYFLLALKNTFIFAGLTCFFKVFFGLFLALQLNQRLYGRNIVRTVFYLPAVLSYIVVGIVFSSMLKMDGLVNNILELIGMVDLQQDWLGNPKTALYCIIITEIWKWSGFTMAIFMAGLQGIPNMYYEAAKIDGATVRQRLRHITLPLLAPAFTISITMNLIGSLKVFEQVYVMTGGGPGFSTQVLGTYIFSTFSAGTLGRSTAMGLIQFIIITAIAVSLNTALRRREVEM